MDKEERKCRMVLIDYTKPRICDKCVFIGHYEEGPFARNPHCCCELQWLLHEEDHKVNPNSMDEECPLKEVVGMR